MGGSNSSTSPVSGRGDGASCGCVNTAADESGGSRAADDPDGIETDCEELLEKLESVG